MLSFTDGLEFYFGAKKRDGSVVIWGGAMEHKLFRNVAKISMTAFSGAIIHTDRTVSTWGRQVCGGDASTVQEQLVDVEDVLFNVYAPARYQNIDSTFDYTADELVALTCQEYEVTGWARKRDGSVVAWGPGDKSGAHSPEAQQLLSQGIEQVHLKRDAALFVRWDKTAFTLGPKTAPVYYETVGNFSVAKEYAETGADSSAVASKLRDIRSVVGRPRSFSVLRSDGSVVVWGAGEPYGAGNASTVASFLESDVEHLVSTGNPMFLFGGETYCAIKKDGTVSCWTGLESNGILLQGVNMVNSRGRGIRRDANGKFEIFAEAYSFVARTNTGLIIQWSSFTELNFVRAPNVPFRQVNVLLQLALFEDGTVVSFDSVLERRRAFEQVQPRLRDIVRIIWPVSFYLDLIVFESADGSLVPWARDMDSALQSWADARFDGMSLGSDIQTSKRLAAIILDTEKGLTSATNQWLSPTHAKQQDPVSVQPSCPITSTSTLSALLLQRKPQGVDVSLASLAKVCEGNVGVTRVDVRLYDDAGQQLQSPLSLRFKVRPAPGSFEAKYFPTPSQQLVEVISQRSGDDVADEYIVDLATGKSTERTILAASGDVLPSPYTRWILSLETPWPEALDVPASISLVFTLSGGACSRQGVDISTIVFAGERDFLSKDGVGPLSLATTCGGMSLLPTESDEKETLSPTTSQVPSEGAGETNSTPKWVVPVAVSGGAVACLVVIAAAVLLVKRRKQSGKTDDANAEQITAKI